MARAKQTISVTIGDTLTDVELASLDQERGVKPQLLHKIRNTHHTLARLLSLGMSNAEAAAACGITESRVSIIKSDPAFQALLTVHQNKKDEIVLDMITKVREVGLMALEEMRDRILDNPEEISTSQLLEIATAALDRTGHGPSSQVSIGHIDFTVLKQNAERARSAQITFRQDYTLGQTIDLPVAETQTDSTSN